jgi:hypothetical protein
MDFDIILEYDVSPWELHPLEMANSLPTLNKQSNGRAMVTISGGMSSAGTTSDLEREVERYHQFAKCRPAELSIRLFADPMEGLRAIGEHVLPK